MRLPFIVLDVRHQKLVLILLLVGHVTKGMIVTSWYIDKCFVGTAQNVVRMPHVVNKGCIVSDRL